MANIKISELTALTSPDAADLVPVTDSSARQTKRTTVGEIVGIINGDVDVANDGTATISELPVGKLQDGDARQLLQTDAAGTGVEWTSNVDVPGTLDVTGVATFDSTVNAAGLASLDGGIDVDGAFTVADTSGNVATSGTLGVTGQSTLASAAVSDLTSGRVVLAGTSGELEDNPGLTFNGTQLAVGGDVVITGDLTVEGASTILETETVKVEDKNIELGVVASPTDVTADGGGITLKGTTDKTINWLNATDAWTLSEHVNIASTKEYRIDGTKVLDATSLGSAVVGSSLTSVGTISTGVWQGTAINATYLDNTLVTTNDTGTVTSTMIENGTIVDADINGSAAIAGTKIAPNFGGQATTTTGSSTASSFVPTGASAPTNGFFLPTTNSVGLATNNTERLRWNASGSQQAFSANDVYRAASEQTAGTSFGFYYGYYSATSTQDGTLAYIVFTNGNVLNTNNSYAGLSDSKLKENIVDAGSQWGDLKALQVRKYNFKEGQTHTQIGVIAQEVELVSPGLVSESPDRDEDGNDLGTVTKSVNYSVLYMKAVKALQEAMERIETLEAKVAALESV